MSAHRITVKELILKLALHPQDMPVCVIYPGWDDPDMYEEGNLDGVTHLEVVDTTEVRSGWEYPARDLGYDNEKVLVLHDGCLDWLTEPLEDK
jgi:hypothetical protein